MYIDCMSLTLTKTTLFSGDLLLINYLDCAGSS